MGRRSACLRRGRVSNRFGSINKAGARHIPQEEHKQKVTAIIQVTKGIICEYTGLLASIGLDTNFPRP